MKKTYALKLIFLMFLLSFLVTSQAGAKIYNDQKRGFSVYVPQGWRINASGKVISISKDTDTIILFIPLAGLSRNTNSVTLLSILYNMAKKTYPDIKILDKRMTPNGNLAQVMVEYTSETRQKIKSQYICRLENGYGMLCGFDSPVGSFNKVQNEFKKALGSIKFNTKAFYQTQKIAAGSTQTQTQRPAYSFGQMVLKQTQDGGCYGVIPQNWTIGGGLAYGSIVVVAEDPNPANSIGAMARTYSLYSGFNYQSAGDYFLREVVPNLPSPGQPMFSNVQVTNRYPDQQALNELAKGGLQGTAEAVEFQAYINMYGKTVRCSFTTSVSSVQGMPIVNIFGIWAPPQIFDSTRNILKQIALSFGTNQSAVQQKINSMNAASSKLSQTLSQTTDIVIAAADSHMQDMNRIIDKYNYYASGEQAYYSEIENKVYVGSSEWGEYMQNPNWTNETMTTNVPDNLWHKIEHDRNWQW